MDFRGQVAVVGPGRGGVRGGGTSAHKCRHVQRFTLAQLAVSVTHTSLSSFSDHLPRTERKEGETAGGGGAGTFPHSVSGSDVWMQAKPEGLHPSCVCVRARIQDSWRSQVT